MQTEQELLRKKKEIENVKIEMSELKGQEKALLKQLKTDWECKTLEAAQKKAETLEDEINTLEDEIEELSQELENKYVED